MVLVKMLMEIALPKMGELLVMMMAMISPFGREVPPAESLSKREKVLLPKFRLETVALRLESLLLIYSRSKSLIYQKMGTGGWPGGPLPTRARQGGRRTLVPSGHLGGPLVFLFSNIFYIFQNKSP